MNILTSILLGIGVICLSYGINQCDIITTIIGAIYLVIYNNIYYHKVENK